MAPTGRNRSKIIFRYLAKFLDILDQNRSFYVQTTVIIVINTPYVLSNIFLCELIRIHYQKNYSTCDKDVY